MHPDDEWKDIIMTKDLSAALSSCRVRERENARTQTYARVTGIIQLYKRTFISSKFFKETIHPKI